MSTRPMTHILFNPLAGNGRGEEGALALQEKLTDRPIRFLPVTEVTDFAAFLANIPAEDTLLITGGDGTLNIFANAIQGLNVPQRLEYYATGSGNDFFLDIGGKKDGMPVDLAPYLRDLPTILVNGQQRLFVNGIGYGIDGYCCEEGDRQRARSKARINYTAIAIKGLLGRYHPTNAEVTIDGVTRTYSHVWLVPTMNGRYFGGGIMPTPAQDRLNPERTVSVAVMHSIGRLPALMLFPKLFTGEHVSHTDVIDIHTGHDITVRFDRPTALQIDGETVLNVQEYRVLSAAAMARLKEEESAQAATV